MTYPDIAETTQWLDQWRVRHMAIDEVMSALELAIGTSTETPLFSAVWDTFQAYTDHLAHRLGDDFDWLAWWWGECNMGAKPKGATSGAGKKLRKIKTTADLARLIVESRK